MTDAERLWKIHQKCNRKVSGRQGEPLPLKTMGPETQEAVRLIAEELKRQGWRPKGK